MKSTSPINSLVKAEDIAGLRIIVGSGTNQEAILLAWNEENLKKGLKPFTPIYTKDDAAQTLALQSGRADAYFGPNVIGAWKAALNGKTKLVGSVDGGWPKAAHIAVTLKKAAAGRTGSNRAERRDQERRLRQSAELGGRRGAYLQFRS